MKYLGLLFFISFLIFSCEPPDPYLYAEDAFIELKKDPCFGFCPVYTFKINGKGHAVYNGDRNVSKEGKWVRQLTPDETNSLFQAFENGDFWALDDEYTSQVTDLPTTWVWR